MSTPRAIVIVGVLIAAAIFLGLRSRGGGVDGTAATGVSPATAERGAQPPQPTAGSPASAPNVPTAAAPNPSAEVDAAAVAKAAMEARRAKLVAECWTPFAEKDPEPPQARFEIQMNFDATGRQIGRGVSDVRGYVRSESSDCLERQPLDIQIPPPGRPVTIRIEFSLPD